MPQRLSPFRLWIPLALTSLMMSAELPIIQAFIGRLPEPHENFAAFGFALQLSMLLYSPTFGLVSASAAFVRDQASYRHTLSLALLVVFLATGVVALVCYRPMFMLIARDWNGLDDAITSIAYPLFICALAWPATVGLRRFFQGVLIRHGRSAKVTIGTIIRLMVLLTTGLALMQATVSGALLGGIALILGTFAEMLAVYLFSRPIVSQLPPPTPLHASGESLRPLVHFYWPIALTSLVNQLTHPMTLWAIGRLDNHLSLLAAFPVAFALISLILGCAFSAQEVVIAILAENRQRLNEILRFAHRLAAALWVVALIIALPPVSRLWFSEVVNLPSDLLPLAIPATLALSFLPPLFVYQTLLRSLLIVEHATFLTTIATVVEVLTLALMLTNLSLFGGLPALISIAVALTISKVVGIGCLWAALKSRGQALSGPPVG